jgi:hypothetical protein
MTNREVILSVIATVSLVGVFAAWFPQATGDEVTPRDILTANLLAGAGDGNGNVYFFKYDPRAPNEMFYCTKGTCRPVELTQD